MNSKKSGDIKITTITTQRQQYLRGSANYLHPRVEIKSTITKMITNGYKRHKGLTNTTNMCVKNKEQMLMKLLLEIAATKLPNVATKDQICEVQSCWELQLIKSEIVDDKPAEYSSKEEQQFYQKISSNNKFEEQQILSVFLSVRAFFYLSPF